MHENTAIIIPAYEEEKYIGKTINLIKTTGYSGKIIVIDDGSKDNTSEVAKKMGATVIRFEKNRGKANAFFAGLRYALRSNSKSIISFDADMTRITKNDLNLCFNKLNEYNKQKLPRMLIPNTYEVYPLESHDKDDRVPHEIAGIRGFTRRMAHLILRSSNKKFAKGYCLEPYLNHLYSDFIKLEKETTFYAESHNRARGKTIAAIHRIHQFEELLIFKHKIKNKFPKRHIL